MAKGLSHRFVLKNGKFVLYEGAPKVKDNLYFLMLFDTVSRIYYADFVPGLLPLVQKPGSAIEIYRTLILGKLKKLILKYVADVKVLDLKILQTRKNPDKKAEIVIAYSYVKENEEVTDTLAQFI